MSPLGDDLFTVGGVTLEGQQVELLVLLVEAHRRVPGQEFSIQEAQSATNRVLLYHPGLQEGLEVQFAAIKTLRDVGLLRLENAGQYLWTFSLLPQARVAYEDFQRSLGQPVERVEQNLRRLFAGEVVQQRYPSAYEKWAQAEDLLWRADAQEQLTAIGHHCREAMQEFATALVNEYQPPDCPTNPASTVARIRAVLEVRRSSLPSTVGPYLEALLKYWGTVNDLAQRQVKGAQREREALTWEDARRVLFQTLIVMVEIDTALTLRT